jgi:hypothetical protein
LLHATGDGFRSYVSCFLLLGLPIVHSAFSGPVFCSLLCATGDGFRY